MGPYDLWEPMGVETQFSEICDVLVRDISDW